jgi:S1-C subfamily serine protease
MAAMTTFDEIQTSIRQHAEGAGSSVVGIGPFPAARAGLSSGDLIVAAAGQPVGGVDDLFDALQGAQGGTLELRVVRGADERTVQVVFTSETESELWHVAMTVPQALSPPR